MINKKDLEYLIETIRDQREYERRNYNKDILESLDKFVKDQERIRGLHISAEGYFHSREGQICDLIEKVEKLND